MKASQMMQTRPYLDVLVYGASGSGKTTWAARSPRPFIALTEQHALPSIVRANPDADVEIYTSFEELWPLIQDLKKGSEVEIEPETGEQPAYRFEHRGEERIVQTVVIDALSDVFSMVVNYCGGVKVGDPAHKIPDLNIQAWGRISRTMENLLHDLRGLPVNVVAISLSETKMDDQSRRYVEPVLSGRTGKMIGQWFAAVGYATQKDDDGVLERRIYWQLPTRFLSKAAPGFPVYITNTWTPGQTTLGSLLLATMPLEVMVPHEEADDPDFVFPKKTTETENESE